MQNDSVGAGGIFAELIEIAGGRPIVCGKDEDTRALDWTHVTGVKPEVLLFALEGMNLEEARAAADRTMARQCRVRSRVAYPTKSRIAKT